MKVIAKVSDSTFLCEINASQLMSLGIYYGNIQVGDKIDISRGIEAATLLRSVESFQIDEQIENTEQILDSLKQVKAEVSKVTMLDKLANPDKYGLPGKDNSDPFDDDIPF